MATLYETLRDARCEIDSHYSDLYVRTTPEAVAIVRASKRQHSHFQNQKAGGAWIEVPFAFDPFWASKFRQGG